MSKGADRKISIAVIGLGFGSDFVPIYKSHPNVEHVGICEMNAELLKKVGDRDGIEDRFTSIDQVLADKRYDAVHILTPVPLHVEQTITALKAGKHVACAVVMGTSLEDLNKVVAECRRTGLNYMMMETGAYTREFLYVQDLYQSSELGNLTFLRGTYYQDLEGDYPRYWWSMPPMHYGTHAIGPLLALLKTRATKVCCLGSGVLNEKIQQPGGNTFPLETAIFRLEGTPVAAEVTRSWFQTARGYCEAFSAYGDKKGFEWQQIEDEDPVLYTLEPVKPGERWRDALPERVKPPFRPDLLPPEIRQFASGGHAGSHPHLVHEFVSSIVEGRPSAINEVIAANWTAPGICAHLSALKDGEPVEIPRFDV